MGPLMPTRMLPMGGKGFDLWAIDTLCFEAEYPRTRVTMLRTSNAPEVVLESYLEGDWVWRPFVAGSVGVELPKRGSRVWVRARTVNGAFARRVADAGQMTSAQEEAAGFLEGDGDLDIDQFEYNHFHFSQPVHAMGSVMSLLSRDLEGNSVPDYAFTGLFYQSLLIEPPRLTADVLGTGCYAWMFAQSTVDRAPLLPARRLEKDCYACMFRGCGSLKDPRSLAKDGILAYGERSCAYMFMGAGVLTLLEMPVPKKLNEKMDSPDTGLPEFPYRCLARAYAGCPNLLAATTYAWAKLVREGKLAYGRECLRQAFAQSGVGAAFVPAPKHSFAAGSPIGGFYKNSCFKEMFAGAGSLSRLDVGFTIWPETGGVSVTENWVDGVMDPDDPSYRQGMCVFGCPRLLGVLTPGGVVEDESHCPPGWTVVYRKELE